MAQKPTDESIESLNGILNAAEEIDLIRFTVVAQRDKLIKENGFSETAAEAMAVHMWAGIWASAAAQAGIQGKVDS